MKTNIFKLNINNFIRDTHKAYVCFKQMDVLGDDPSKNNQRILSTGNWGCGAFGCDFELMFVSQWIVASFFNASCLEYYTFGNSNMEKCIEKLEIINLQLLKRNNAKKKMIFWSSIIVCSIIILAWICLILFGSPYLSWDYSNSETAVLGVGFHIFEWLFVRISPFILVVAIFGIVLSRKKQD